jgi:hypothetical protein
VLGILNWKTHTKRNNGSRAFSIIATAFSFVKEKNMHPASIMVDAIIIHADMDAIVSLKNKVSYNISFCTAGTYFYLCMKLWPTLDVVPITAALSTNLPF